MLLKFYSKTKPKIKDKSCLRAQRLPWANTQLRINKFLLEFLGSYVS